MKYPCIKRAKNPEASLEVNSSTSTSCLLCCPSVWATVFLCVLFYPITPHFDTGQACSPSLPNSCGARSGRWWKRNKMNWQGLMSAPSSLALTSTASVSLLCPRYYEALASVSIIQTWSVLAITVTELNTFWFLPHTTYIYIYIIFYSKKCIQLYKCRQDSNNFR